MKRFRLIKRLREQSERRSLSGYTRSLLTDAAECIENGVDVADDDFGTMLVCAVRYAIGRRSYMPRLVVEFITPLLPRLSKKALWCFDKDISDCEYFGDPDIDKPLWEEFHANVRTERTKRGEELYKSWRDNE